jgi:membrane fusion protein (multidrug efflux system)
VTPRLIIKKYIFIIIPLVILLLAALVILKTVLAPSPPMVRPPARVAVIEAKKTPVRNSYEVVGVLEAGQSVDLVARVTGFLEEKSAQAGGRAAEGDTLFKIDSKLYQAQRDAAQAALMSAQAQETQARLSYSRTADLYAKRTAPKNDLDSATAALNVAQAAVLAAQANLAQAELNLEWAEVKAPFAGVLSDSPVSVGSYVGTDSEVLATLVSSDHMEVRFGVADRQLANLRFQGESGSLPRGSIGEVTVRLKINGVHIYERGGKITYVSPLVDKSTDTVRLKASFPNPDGKLVSGEVVTVVLEDSQPREAILLPKNCVLYTAAQGSFVYVLGEAKDQSGNPTGGQAAEQRMVARGVEFPDGMEITQGLEPGDKVINLGLMSGGALIQPGAPVVLIERPEGGAPGAEGQPGAPGGGAPADGASGGGSPAQGGASGNGSSAPAQGGAGSPGQAQGPGAAGAGQNSGGGE